MFFLKKSNVLKITKLFKKQNKKDFKLSKSYVYRN